MATVYGAIIPVCGAELVIDYPGRDWNPTLETFHTLAEKFDDLSNRLAAAISLSERGDPSRLTVEWKVWNALRSGPCRTTELAKRCDTGEAHVRNCISSLRRRHGQRAIIWDRKTGYCRADFRLQP